MEPHRDKTRTFLAVLLPDAARRELERLQDSLRQQAGPSARVKWVAPANLHITLQFLGDVEGKRRQLLTRLLAGRLAGLRQFEFSLEGCGAFPSPSRPRVIWAGCGAGAERLAELAQAVQETTRELGFTPEERPFRPHVTLGRVRDRRRSGGLGRALERNRGFSGGRCRCRVVHVMASELRPQGPLYRTLDSVPLGG